MAGRAGFDLREAGVGGFAPDKLGLRIDGADAEGAGGAVHEHKVADGVGVGVEGEGEPGGGDDGGGRLRRKPLGMGRSSEGEQQRKGEQRFHGGGFAGIQSCGMVTVPQSQTMLISPSRP